MQSKAIIWLLSLHCVAAVPVKREANIYKRDVSTNHFNPEGFGSKIIAGAPSAHNEDTKNETPKLSLSLSLPEGGGPLFTNDLSGNGDQRKISVPSEINVQSNLEIKEDSRNPESSIFYKAPEIDPRIKKLGNSETVQKPLENEDSRPNLSPIDSLEQPHNKINEKSETELIYELPEFQNSPDSFHNQNVPHDGREPIAVDLNLPSEQPLPQLDTKGSGPDGTRLFETPVPVNQSPKISSLYGIPEGSEDTSNIVPLIPEGNELENPEIPSEGRGLEFLIPPNPQNGLQGFNKNHFAEESFQNEVFLTLEDQNVPVSNVKDMSGGMPFNYDWGVRDPKNRNLFSHRTASDGSVTHGEYSVLLPDGRYQVVRYRDEGNGLHVDLVYVNPPDF